jgi:hypothetical protein
MNAPRFTYPLWIQETKGHNYHDQQPQAEHNPARLLARRSPTAPTKQQDHAGGDD